jgi:hypothetical protein
VRKQCDRDKGEGTKTAGLTIGSTVVEQLGGRDKRKMFFGKELMLEMAVEDVFWQRVDV